MSKPGLDNVFGDWKEREALAEAMLPLIGSLYRRNVVIHIYGRPCYNQSVIDLMKIHRFVREIEQNELSEFETHPMLAELCKMDLGPAHIDLGKLTVHYMENPGGLSVAEYLKRECASVIGNYKAPALRSTDVVIYGFGRIGRLVGRLLVEKTGGGDQLRWRAVVLRPPKDPIEDLHKRAALFERDSIHGPFKGTVRIDEENQVLICNGNVVHFIYSNDPSKIDYTQYGIGDALIMDTSGAWRDKEGLSLHLKSRGASKVLLATNAKGDIPNIVHGVNSNLITDEHKILGAGSCTTNAIIPVLKCMDDEFGIVHGHMETVHAYTNDQNLVDDIHSKERRGRSAALNMVLTETGASRSVGKLLPNLDGKLTANAIRVPVANVSMAILSLTVARETTKDEINEFFRNVALNSPLNRQIDYTVTPEVVSSDFIGSRHACIVDSHATIAEGNRVVLYVWYDNEFGYCCQMVRVAQKMAGIRYPLIPAEPVMDTNGLTVEAPKLKSAATGG